MVTLIDTHTKFFITFVSMNASRWILSYLLSNLLIGARQRIIVLEHICRSIVHKRAPVCPTLRHLNVRVVAHLPQY